MSDENEEVRLLKLIREASPGPDRTSLIEKLDNVPIGPRGRHFWDRWFSIHHVDYLDCWSEAGYDPSGSKFPRDIQLLAAASYGTSDINNGGFHQFFTNFTGKLAPEMQEWFERAGLNTAAMAIRNAIAVFGAEFPRSQSARRDAIAKLEDESRQDWWPDYWDASLNYEANPFNEMDDQFDDTGFDLAADHWLQHVCGIRTLLDGF